MKRAPALTADHAHRAGFGRRSRTNSAGDGAPRSVLIAALAVCVLVAVLGGTVTEPAAASHLRDKCFPSGSTTVYQTAEGRFYTRRVEPYFGGDRAVFACSYRYGRSYRLWEGDFSDPSSYSLFRITGHFAGYVVDPGCPVDDPCGVKPRITSLNLRTGEDRAYTGTTLSDAFEEDVHDLVLRGNGSIASIATASRMGDDTPPSAIQVRALGANGLRMLDRGRGIGLRSLELNDATVSWLKYGVRRSATLR